ncbi:MAG: hypothetical protein HETSPECPRED_006578 [Heterodermia speciosa]|uniref:Uncharacterized protein n=1 Tax=Heterodermia speciosa TaxID=116794 RepID=A0A8H3FQX1_9LECA|nr:MAG: hypothetical protein HETSPECPRED_006578 [Heterodermia speciosa]
MRKHHLLFLCVFPFSCTNGETLKLARPSDPSPSIPLSNNTVSLSGDSRFALQPHYTSTRLSATAILMNTITFLSEAADYGFESYLDINRRASFSAYPTVMIDIQTVKAKDRLQNFLLIWALYEATWDMVAKNNFSVSVFDMVWKGKVVARLRYMTPPGSGVEQRIGIGEQQGGKTVVSPGLAALGGKETLLANVTLSEIESTNFTSTALLPLNTTTNGVLAMRMQFLRNGRDLPIYTVFMTVMATLVKNAYYPAKSRIRPFDASTPGFNAQIAISVNTGPGSQQAPFFERDHLNHAIQQLPSFMLEERTFKEIAFTVMLDNKE